MGARVKPRGFRGRRGGHRIDVPLRVIAAVPLNYVVTTTLVVLLARILPDGAPGRSITATLLAFAIFAGLAMACFAVRNAVRAFAVMVPLGLCAGLADWALIASGGRL